MQTPPDPSLHRGPFTLHTLIGRGGMGEVWRGIHRTSGQTVAIKQLSAWRDSPQARLQFTQELQALARLQHPHIVEVFDYGTVPAGEAGAPGSVPYFVMEWLPASLRSVAVCPPLARVLRDVLRGLAHAHARGIIHRDIKPGNLLLGLDGSTRLADFGISAQADHPEVMQSAGTLAYMAPEQLEGGPQGPWTDLYAVGCVAWELLTGHPPVQVADVAQARWARRAWTLPLTPGWPAALREWLQGLLAPDATDRYAHAAQALRALEALPAGLWDDLPAITGTTDGDDGTGTGTIEVGAHPAATRSVLADWPRAAPPPTDVSGAPPLPVVQRQGRRAQEGLGLWGLRPTPFVGRAAEITRLWAALERVCTTRRLTISVVTGRVGVGKSRLTDWLSLHAAERGAVVLRLHHQPHDGPTDALRRGLRRWDREAWPQAPLPEPLVQLRGDQPVPIAAVHEALAGWLRRLTQQRPVVLVADDLQWGPSTRDFLEGLRLQGALWVLATVRADLLPLEQLPPIFSTHVEALDALSDAEQVHWLDALLPLEPALRSRIVARTTGHPLFAVHLLGDWIDREVLVAGPAGLRLRDGVSDTLPDVLHTLLAPQLTRWEGAPLTALELAAVLGHHVDAAEWQALCMQEGLGDPALWVDSFTRAGLLAPLGDGWVFAHGLLRESIQRRAERRLPAHHRACAQVLADRLDLEVLGSAERLARHWEEADAQPQARAAMGKALSVARALAPVSVDTRRIAEGYLRMLAAAGTAPLDPELLLTREVHLNCMLDASSNLDPAAIDALEADARAAGETTILLRCRLFRLQSALWQRRYPEALQHAEILIAKSRAAGELDMLAIALQRHGGILEHLGDAAGSLPSLRESVVVARQSGFPRMEAEALSRLAEHYQAHGALEAALEHATQASRLFALQPRLSPRSITHGLLIAELARKQARWTEARAHQQQTLENLERMGMEEGFLGNLTRLCGALILLGEVRLDEATAQFLDLRDRWHAEGHTYAFIADLHLAHIDALQHRWPAVLAFAGRWPAPPFIPDPDIPEALDAIEDAARTDAQADVLATMTDLGAAWRAWQRSGA